MQHEAAVVEQSLIVQINEVAYPPRLPWAVSSWAAPTFYRVAGYPAGFGFV